MFLRGPLLTKQMRTYNRLPKSCMACKKSCLDTKRWRGTFSSLKVGPHKQAPRNVNVRQTEKNNLHTHRKKAGLSQNELARLVDCAEGSVCRHENSTVLPPLITAMKYQAIFQVPIAELFPGLRLRVEQCVQDNISKLEGEFHDQSVRSPHKARRHAKKLAWLDERRTVLEA